MTTSVIKSLEFVFLNLRLTFGEDSLFLSIQRALICTRPTFSSWPLTITSLPVSPPPTGLPVRSDTDDNDCSTNTPSRWEDDWRVLEVRYEAFPRARRHRNRRPRRNRWSENSGWVRDFVKDPTSLHEVVLLGLMVCEKIWFINRVRFFPYEVRSVPTAVKVAEKYRKDCKRLKMNEREKE